MHRHRMRHILAATIFLTLCVGSLAPAISAEPPRPADRAAIETCLKEREVRSEPVERCVDALAMPCLDKPESFSTQGQAACFWREHAVWDTMLNENYKKLRGQLGGEQAKTLQDLQRAWIASRDKSCHFFHDFFEGGTMAIPLSASCISAETGRRALFLRQFVIIGSGG